MKVHQFLVEARLLEPMLGTAPADPDIYKSFIATKKAKADKLAGKEAEAVTEVISKEELALLPVLDDSNKGVTVFRRNKTGLILMDFMARGFLKESATAISGTWGVNSKIDKWIHVQERQIPLLRNGVQIEKPDDIFERPLRAMTMQGPRVALAASEIIKPPVEFSFHMLLLPLGLDDKKGKLSFEEILSWLEYGILNGFGQWRSGGYGRFVGKTTDLGTVNYSVDFDSLEPSITK